MSEIFLTEMSRFGAVIGGILTLVVMILVCTAASCIEDERDRGEPRKAIILLGILIPTVIISAILFMVFFAVPKINS